MRSRIRLAFTVIALILACFIFACVYWFVFPFLTGFDPCLSTILAPQEIVAIRTHYQEFYDLNKRGNYEQAYQYTSATYRTQHSFEEYKHKAEYVFQFMWGVELRPDSSIFVCGNNADLFAVKYQGFIGYYGYFHLVKEGGQWYVDYLEYAQD